MHWSILLIVETIVKEILNEYKWYFVTGLICLCIGFAAGAKSFTRTVVKEIRIDKPTENFEETHEKRVLKIEKEVDRMDSDDLSREFQRMFGGPSPDKKGTSL